MKITVVYMGGSRGQSGCPQETLELPDGATIAQAAEIIVKQHPTLGPLLESVRWARNYEFAALEDGLTAGDELAILPPVAGGSPRALLTEAPLDPAVAESQVAGPGVGATVVFIGTVRDHARGQAVERLEYEAYEPMATRQLEKIAQSCSELRTGSNVVIHHRHGNLQVGDIAVVIAASSAHRDDAFTCCREAIEQIKVDVPIWKREVSPDGSSWVGWGGG